MVFDDLGIVLQRMFGRNFNKQAGETILFITDVVSEDYNTDISPEKKELINNRAKFVELLSIRAKDLYGSDNVDFITYPSTLQHGEDPSSSILHFLENHDIFIALTSYSITYCNLIKKALQKGARGASMPLATPELFKLEGPLGIDHLKMAERGEKFIRKFDQLRDSHSNHYCEVQIFDTKQNMLKLNILEGDNHFIKDFGLYHNATNYGNLPAGEIYTVPDFQAVASGNISIPKKYTNYCQEKAEFLEFELSQGKVISTKGAKNILNEYLGFHQGKNSPESKEIENSRRNLALFGLGLNANATGNNSILESSKMLGCCHLGFGGSEGIGGLIKSDLHLGFIVPGVDLIVNQEKVLDAGIPVFMN